MVRIARVVALAWLATFLSSCSLQSVLPPVPATTSQALAVAEAELTSLKLAAAELVDSHVLTGDRMERADNLFQEADKVRGQARTAWDAGNIAYLDGRLAALTRLLIDLRKEVSQ